MNDSAHNFRPKLPPWIRVRVPCGEEREHVEALLKVNALNTVCRGAQCPNLCECFHHSTATFLILGNKLMVVSLIGIMFFSMTTSVTIGMAVSVMKIAPGAAFGVTTIALFVGATISWFTGGGSFLTNVVIIVITSAICFLMSMYIIKPEREVA